MAPLMCMVEVRGVYSGYAWRAASSAMRSDINSCASLGLSGRKPRATDPKDGGAWALHYAGLGTHSRYCACFQFGVLWSETRPSQATAEGGRPNLADEFFPSSALGTIGDSSLDNKL
eukprot:4990514-Amphidinium_carterae.1